RSGYCPTSQILDRAKTLCSNIYAPALLPARGSIQTMIQSSKRIAVVLLVAIFLSASSAPVLAQDGRDKPKSNWPIESKSVVKKTGEGVTAVTLSEEPVMRIALSTGIGAATI